MGKIYNNGDPYEFGDGFIGRHNHFMILFEDIKEVSFQADKCNFFTNLLGLGKGTLTIKYKRFFYSTELTELTIDIKRSEFDMVRNLVAKMEKVIIAEEERQKKINEAIERKIQNDKKQQDLSRG